MLFYRNAEGVHGQRKFDNTFPKPKLSPVSWGWLWLGGLSPPKQSSKPQIETWNTINQWSFCQFLDCQATPHKRKAPHGNARFPYWKLSGDGSS